MKLLRFATTVVCLTYLLVTSLTVYVYINQSRAAQFVSSAGSARTAVPTIAVTTTTSMQDETGSRIAAAEESRAATSSSPSPSPSPSPSLSPSASAALFPPAPSTLIATFGSGAMADFILNWAANVQDIPSLHPFYVFALDEELRDVCVENNYNVILVPEFIESNMRSGLRPSTMPAPSPSDTDGKGGGEKSNSAYYRHDVEAFRLMGANKALFLHLLLLKGYDVLLSDADTVWMSDPWQWIPRQQQEKQAMHPLALHFEQADMLVSTDTAEPLRMYWPPLITTEHNTGILWMRSCNATILLTAEWHFQSMTFQGPTHDQTELNFILKGHYPTPGVTATADDKSRSGEAYPYIPHFIVSGDSRFSEAGSGSSSSLFRADRTQHFKELADKYPSLQGLEVAQVNVEATKSRLQGQIEHAVTSLHPKNASAFLSSSSSSSSSDAASPVAFLTFVMWRGRISVGMLPLNVFLNGMSFFTFGVQRSLPASSPPLRPVVVHATYQFADESAYSYGKRQRFREHGMWKIDPPSYYQGKYLQVVEWESVIASLAHDFQQSLFAESPQAAEALFQCQSPSDFRFPLDPAMGCFHPGHSIVDLDDKGAVNKYRARLESGALNLRTVHDPAELHLRVQSTLRTVLRNAFAIAKPADRAVIFPPLWCLCARFWWIASDCILVGQENHVGAAYNCPMDHNIMPGRLSQDKDDNKNKDKSTSKDKSTNKVLLEFRESQFLDHLEKWIEEEQDKGEGAVDKSELTPKRLVREKSAKSGDIAVDMDHGISGVLGAIESLPSVRVLSISAQDLLDLGDCGYSDKQQTLAFNSLISQAFPKSQHIFFCSRERNPPDYLENIAARAKRDGVDPMSYIKADFNCTGTDPSYPRGLRDLGPSPLKVCE